MQHLQIESIWFLAQFKPNCHKIAVRNLRRQNFQTFLPMQEETKRRSGQFITTLRPLFSGYLFVAFDISKGGWSAINNTYGVTRLVNFCGDPQPVPFDLISRLMQRCDEDGKLLPPPTLKVGDMVKMSSGPFAEFVATVEKINPDQRVWVLLDMLGRTTRIAVHPDVLQMV